MSVRAIQAGRAVILIQATDLTGQTLARISNNMKRFGATMTRVGEQSMRGGLLGGIASGMTLRNFFKFDDLMKELRAKFGYLGDMTIEQSRAMAVMEKRIRQLGKTTSYTSQEVAQAAIVLAQGGLDPKEVENSLQAILDLGRGTRTALDMAANMYVRAMRAFNISSSEANSTVSQFVRATRYGVLELSDLESGLRYSSGTAATLGQNMAPILAILTQLSNVGLAGSIGGTSLNTAMANLVKKLEKIKARFPGFEPAKKNGDLDLLGTLERLYSYTAKLTKMERIEVFQDLFNLRGARAIAGAQDIESILGMAKAIEKAGNEARTAADLMDSGPGGSWRKLTSAVDDLSLALGKAAEGPVVGMIHAATLLANAFNKVVETNKPLATLLVLSPAIAVAAGVGFITLGKALAIAGTSFGLATLGLRKFLGLIAGGTVRQIQALTATFQGLRAGSVAHMGLGQMKQGITSAVRFGTHGATSAARSQARVMTGTAKMRTLQKMATQHAKMTSMYAQLRMSPQAAKHARHFQATQRLITATRTTTNLARGARGSALRSILPALGTGIKDTIKGMRALTISTGKVLWATRRLIPSWFTLLEIFIFFGNKIPGMNVVWNQFAKGFIAAGRAIGRIGTYMQGPIKLFITSFEALFRGNAASGLNGILIALKGMANIVANQLVSAWNLFKASIAGTWDTVKVVFTAIIQLVTNLITTIATSVGAITASGTSVFGDLFSGGSGSWVTDFAQTTMKFINSLFYWIDIAVLKIGQVFQNVVAQLRAWGATFWQWKTGQTDESIAARLSSDRQASLNEFKLKSKDRETQLKTQQSEVEKIFKEIADNQTQKQAMQTSQQRELMSSNINQFTNQLANQLRTLTNQIKPSSPQEDNGYKPLKSGYALNNKATQESKTIAGSLIGYMSSNSYNRIKFGDKIAKEQLSVLEDIRENTENIKDRAETFE